jgi:hypothetical protein
MNTDFALDTRPLFGKLKDLRPLKILLVNKTAWEPVWDYLVRTCHYLGYETMIGPRVKYLVFHEDRPIAALSYNRAALHVGVRDSFLDWTPAQKHRLLPHVVNNRFLILPWVRVKNLASHLLASTLKRLRQDWPRLYGTEPFLVETFIDPQYRGTCYQAANWLYLGETRGFARVGKTYIRHGKCKSVFVYLLNPAFLKIIAEDPCRHPNPPPKKVCCISRTGARTFWRKLALLPRRWSNSALSWTNTWPISRNVTSEANSVNTARPLSRVCSAI